MMSSDSKKCLNRLVGLMIHIHATAAREREGLIGSVSVRSVHIGESGLDVLGEEKPKKLKILEKGIEREKKFSLFYFIFQKVLTKYG